MLGNVEQYLSKLWTFYQKIVILYLTKGEIIMSEDMKKIKEIVNNYTEQEILEALIVKSGCDVKKLDDIVEQFCIKDIKKVDDNTYHTPNGVIKKLDTFKGKRALVGDYLNASFFNTKMVLYSLGIDIVNEKSCNNMYDRLKNGEKYDVVFTNNIYDDGTGPELVKKLKQLDGFNIPVIIHTISEMPVDYFLNMGFDGCLKKPIKQEETIEVLNKLF